MLNDEGAAVLEILAMHDGMSPSLVCEALAADSGVAVSEVECAMGLAWPRLVDSGLVRQRLPDTHPST